MISVYTNHTHTFIVILAARGSVKKLKYSLKKDYNIKLSIVPHYVSETCDALCCLGYPNENAVHIALKTVRNWLDKLTARNKVSIGYTVSFLLTKTKIAKNEKITYQLTNNSRPTNNRTTALYS